MRSLKLLCVGIVLVLLACGKSGDRKAASGAGDSTAADTSSSERPSAIAATLSAKGFRVMEDRHVPSQQSGRVASIVVYQTSDGSHGGVLYVQRPTGGGKEDVVWHEYFDESAPDSAAVTEINGDGLWDIRVFVKNGQPVDLVQRQSITLTGTPLGAPLAFDSKVPLPGDAWKCFDGDEMTSWKAPSADAAIELRNPLGAPVSEVDVRLGDDHPGKLELYAGNSRVQEIDLAATTDAQRFKLNAGLRNASSIRLQVEGSPQISEMSIR